MLMKILVVVQRRMQKDEKQQYLLHRNRLKSDTYVENPHATITTKLYVVYRRKKLIWKCVQRNTTCNEKLCVKIRCWPTEPSRNPFSDRHPAFKQHASIPFSLLEPLSAQLLGNKHKLAISDTRSSKNRPTPTEFLFGQSFGLKMQIVQESDFKFATNRRSSGWTGRPENLWRT